MLVEKFDFIELLRLAIANGNGKGAVTKEVILGEIALLSTNARMWAEILLEKVDFERIAKITETKKIYETNIINGREVKKRIDEIPGKVEIIKGKPASADFFRVRNKLAVKLHNEMVKNKFKPANFNGDLVRTAKGMAEIVLRGHLFVKAMCGGCQGIGKYELFYNGQPDGSKFCDKCGGSGKRPYTLNEKIDIAGLTLTKTNYLKSYQKYENFGESIVAQWENEIRSRISRSFRIDLPITEDAHA
ncbi:MULTISPECIES: hypothetical protein [Acinetobacter]|uniref:hypothetical protein n=1 Tax=Acinetobacter TaxID=469 RepID=UPI0024488E61|nr:MULTISPECIES: hypothetical protein [Acinetobacter]MDH0032027.1 hypothetical protein [Acinetobacter sp. GD04021]MDH0887683.1 hypothetical protein [Acinetobacter sp. GD03873]MDH1084031.1 hypothetical protein [Acinetobacter sp. GD03983]MDH2191042.1 hypothetical protein [Acinetobacter sp. GD03645]MDH2204543.1 hypothetical protein [Acinetobacter sp. GD03647]